MSGWLKLHRQLQDNRLWLSEPFTRGQAWVDLMMMANYEESYIRVRGRRINIPVGGVARAQTTLAKRWQWSRGKVQRFLKELENDKQIEQQTSHDFNVIKLCNYSDFQRDGSRDDTRHGSRDGSRVGHEIGHETGHIKEEINNKKEIKETTPPTGVGDVLLANEFVISFPTKGDGQFDIDQAMLARYQENYPSLDVRAQLGSMCQYLEDNPHKQQPEWNYKSWVISWLNNRLGDQAPKVNGLNTHGGFDAERYRIDDTARKFNIAGVDP